MRSIISESSQLQQVTIMYVKARDLKIPVPKKKFCQKCQMKVLWGNTDMTMVPLRLFSKYTANRKTWFLNKNNGL